MKRWLYEKKTFLDENNVTKYSVFIYDIIKWALSKNNQFLLMIQVYK